MDTETLKRDLDVFHTTDRFTPLLIFASNHDFPAFAKAHNIGFKAGMGLYQGIIEESYIVSGRDTGFIVEAEMLKGQQSVLLLMSQEAVYGGHRAVFLVQVNDAGRLGSFPEFIGHWRKVSCNEALHRDAWTCDPEDNAWYVAKMPDTLTCDTLSQ